MHTIVEFQDYEKSDLCMHSENTRVEVHLSYLITTESMYT